MDAINASLARARVLARGATARGGPLDRGVGDIVARAGARRALEDVVEPEPVADLVHGGVAHVVVGGAAAGHGVGEVDAAVED